MTGSGSGGTNGFVRCGGLETGEISPQIDDMTGRSGAPVECFAEAEQSRKAEEGGLRQALGAHAEILDLAIGDATAREIGESRGYSGKHAERRGIF